MDSLFDEWSFTETALAAAFGIGVVSFMVLYCTLILPTHNAIIAVTRLRSCVHVCAWVLLCLYFALLYFELVEQRRIEWPHLGVARPIVCIVLGCFYFFTTTHPAFRWLVLLLSGTSVVCNTYESAMLRIVYLCRKDAVCTSRPLNTVLMLEVQWARNLMDIVVGTIMFMLIIAMMMSLGWFTSLLPPRLFDTSIPMSFVPPSSGGNPHLLLGLQAGAQRGYTTFARNQEVARGEKISSSKPGLEEEEESKASGGAAAGASAGTSSSGGDTGKGVSGDAGEASATGSAASGSGPPIAAGLRSRPTASASSTSKTAVTH